MQIRKLFSLAAVLFATQLPASADFSLGFGQEEETSYTSYAAKASVENYSAEKPFFIAYTIDAVKPWHSYFRNPGTVGMPLEVSLEAPEGFSVKGPYWPIPKRYTGQYSTAYGYSTATFVWEITPTATTTSEVEFTFKSTAQVCDDEGCASPKDDTTKLKLSAGNGAANPAWAGEEKKVEGLGDTEIKITLSQTTTTVTLHFETDKAIEKAYFFSNDNSIAPALEQKLEKTATGYSLLLPRNDNSDTMHPPVDEAQVGKPLEKLEGILQFGDEFTSVNAGFEAVINSAPEMSRTFLIEILGIIGGLFLGGLILNLMPCVFPVIGLKIMSFVEMGGGSRRKIFMHSLAFVVGVLFSFFVLSLILIIAAKINVLAELPWTEWFSAVWNDQGSTEISWAAWLQNSWVVYGLLLILMVLGMSMYGVFEIGVGATGAGQGLQQKKGYSGSFFSGLLATIVATPCSAPFLGPALASALALPAPWLLLCMSFMGLGLASPYLIMGLFPSLVRFLPRPGAWMESLKQGLSFLLFAAAAWLLFVYLAFTNDQMWMLIGLVIIASGFWVYGRWCPIYRTKLTRFIGLLFTLGLVGSGVYLSMPPSEEELAAAPVWVEWSPEAMEKALEDGKPVFVDYTAAWCATCQSNKKTAYSQEVYAKFKTGNVVLMKADKTKPNEAIDAELRRLGQGTVPVNALYRPDEEPIITEVILTPGYLLNFIETNIEIEGDEP